MLVWDPQEGYDHVLNGVRHHFDSILQRKRKNRYAVTALRRLFTLPCHLPKPYSNSPSSPTCKPVLGVITAPAPLAV